ncbi:hypothetical protein BN1708_020292, partial [Verticillium longisporum]
HLSAIEPRRCRAQERRFLQLSQR